ncbi:hypothetical protein QQS21_009960 [Conoideocrella luteorostrata]|uniref:Uncharacterized protein n=1 Tax=Conoideocrella luteorostrata TaxID=1105319 RepID=A0AAJ0CKF0_9HYPO|nr:hypothetical protein QQS21_009960 [Conoideocrella luteorostrata]
MLGSAMLPGGRAYSTTAQTYASGGWTSTIPELYDSESTLRYASMATAASIIASDNNDEQLRIKGLQTYNRAVGEASKALQQPDWYKRDGLLAASRLMATYEVLFPPMKGAHIMAWRGHSEGQQAMILGRGPSAFTTGTSHQLFIDARINMIMLAIGRRRRSPLGTHAWKTVPWSFLEKSIKDELLDQMVDMPMIFEQVAAFQALPPEASTEQLVKRILKQCDAVEAEVAAWAAKASSDVRRFDYTVAGTRLPKPQSDADFALAHMSTIYWFTLMMLYSVRTFFSDIAGKTESPVWRDSTGSRVELLNRDSQPSFGAKSPELYAAKCVHTMPLFFERNGGVIEGTSGLLALSICLRFILTTGLIGKGSVEMHIMRDTLELSVLGVRVGDLLHRIYGVRISLDAVDEECRRPERYLEWF